VDVSCSTLEVRIGRQGATGSFPNTAAGIAALASFCRAHEVELVAMEATGGYEKQPFTVLAEQGLPVTILNPRAVRRFAEGMGLLEKTDTIDAGLIAWFAEVKKSQPRPVPSAGQQQLRALVTRLRRATQSAPPGQRSGGRGLFRSTVGRGQRSDQTTGDRHRRSDLPRPAVA
jgi:transposase